jgi:hypothetical protein
MFFYSEEGEKQNEAMVRRRAERFTNLFPGFVG